MSAEGMAQLDKKLSTKPKVEKDFRRLLDDPDVDAVVIATPDHWHAVMTRLALDAGKHVYLEKPATYCVNEGRTLVEEGAKRPGQTLLVGTQQRSGSHFRDVRDFVQSGGLGRVGFCRAWATYERERLAPVPDSDPPTSLDYGMWLGPAPMRPYNENRLHYNWRWFRDYGTGEMGNWGSHWLDIVLWSLGLGMPEAVVGVGGQFVFNDGREWPDTQSVVFEYPNLVVQWEHRIWTKFPCNGNPTGAQFDGEKGSLVVTRDGWTFHPKDGKPQSHKGSEIDKAHAVHFADCIRGDATPVATMEDGHISASLCHLGNIAVTLNRRLAFDKEQYTFGDPEADALLGREYRAPWSMGA